MTGSRDFKRLVRKRMAETGESYTVARSHFDAPPKTTTAREKASKAPTTVDAFNAKVYTRRRTKDLAAHLEEHYGVRVSDTTKLDLGVYRVDRRGESSWIARVFPAARSVEAARGDAEILAFLQEEGFPAERLAHADPVSMLAGQAVLVTDYVDGSNRRFDTSERTMHSLGAMLGRLHVLPNATGACARPAGSWHHLSVNGGGRRSDVTVLLALLDDEESRRGTDDRALLKTLREELEALDDLEDLPKALMHPDPCSANLIAPDDDEGVLIDWTGAGHGPRIAAFANLICSTRSLALVDAAVDGYRGHASLESAELDRLEPALIGFPLILDYWRMLFQGESPRVLVSRLVVHRERAARVAAQARSAFAAPAASLAPKVDERQGSLF